MLKLFDKRLYKAIKKKIINRNKRYCGLGCNELLFIFVFRGGLVVNAGCRKQRQQFIHFLISRFVANKSLALYSNEFQSKGGGKNHSRLWVTLMDNGGWGWIKSPPLNYQNNNGIKRGYNGFLDTWQKPLFISYYLIYRVYLLPRLKYFILH